MGADAPLVHTNGGTIAGVHLGHGCRAFKGIRYAQPPTGARRWQPPVPAGPWPGIQSAVQFGAACIQPPTAADSVYRDDPPQMSEDCLFLNIWALESATRAPVMVFIHGGSLRIGHAGSALHDGSALARRGVIVVTLNYRLGLFGYFAHPQLTAESSHRSSGNYGLLDQIEALRWVRAHIERFGGDPNNVTVFGESAGALSIIELLASARARGLFHRAILQSGYLMSSPELTRASHGELSAHAAGEALAAKLGATDLSALRALPARQLCEAAVTAGYTPQPTIDGWVLPKQMLEVFDAGEQAAVPVIVGFNAGEASSLPVFHPPLPATAADYEMQVRTRYRDLADRYLAFYPPHDIRASALEAARDAFYAWSAERLVRDHSRLGQAAYLYYFDHAYPAAVQRQLTAFHGSELPYVFGLIGSRVPLPPNWPPPPDEPAERALSEAIMRYFIAFARSGEPQTPAEPAWPPYAHGRAFLHFTDRATASRDLLPQRFELHEAVIARRRAAGTQNWTVNVGLASPVIPDAISAGA